MILLFRRLERSGFPVCPSLVSHSPSGQHLAKIPDLANHRPSMISVAGASVIGLLDRLRFPLQGLPYPSIYHCEQLIDGIYTIGDSSDVDLHLLPMHGVVAADHL